MKNQKKLERVGERKRERWSDRQKESDFEREKIMIKEMLRNCIERGELMRKRKERIKRDSEKKKEKVRIHKRVINREV